MRVLVTGSSGLVGAALCRALDARGWRSVGLDLRAASTTQHVGDVNDPSVARDAAEGVDAIVHCAAQVSTARAIDEPRVDATANVLGTLAMLEAARERAVRRFVYVSSAAVFGEPERVPVDESHPTRPMGPYGISKLAGEQYARFYGQARGLDVVVVRPFNIYADRLEGSDYSGVVRRFVEAIERDQPPTIYGDGRQTRDFVHVDDVVDLLVRVAHAPEAAGATINVGSGEPTSLLALLAMLTDLTGRKPEPRFLPPRPGDIRDSWADIRAARRLGYAPKVQLREGLRRLLRARGALSQG